MTADGAPAETERPRRRRRFLRAAGWLVLGAAVAGVALFFSGWRAYGKRPAGARLARMQSSPNWKGGRFVNPEPMENDLVGAVLGVIHKSPYTSPDGPVATHAVTERNFRIDPVTWLGVTWFGHSTFLVEIEGCRILIDPVWSERISPVPIGPKRWYGPSSPSASCPGSTSS